MTSAILDLNTIDKSVKPANDFYHYAVGRWVKKAKIPADKPAWNFFAAQSEKNTKLIYQLVKTSQKATRPESEEYKIGTLFSLGMDEKKIGKEGIAPLKEEFSRIENIKTREDLAREIAHMHLYTCGPLFSFNPTPDPENSAMTIAETWQSGLSLPDRNYYLEKSSKEIRDKYLAYMQKIFILLGESSSEAKSNANTVLKIETAMARVSMNKVDLRDPLKSLHKMSGKEFTRLAPNFYWQDYFKSLGVDQPEILNVGQPEFFKGIDKILKTCSLDELKIYLRWHLINAMSPHLGKDFVNANFDFYARTFSGLESIPPRWKRIVGVVNGSLGEALGKVYVKKYFPASSKQKMLALVKNIIKATGRRIQNLTWMEEPTKKEALKKLSRIKLKIGYPDKWRDYSKLKIKKDNFIANLLRVNYFNAQRELNKIGKPTDKKEWHMLPQTVNAYFSPPNNEIAFPAGILQPIMFNPKADDAINYGAIGAVIAHEITHAFDDQGRKYDSKGNLHDWWTKEDDRRFRERAELLEKQFSEYIVIDNLHINGKLTLGENLADLGGLNISLDALKYSLKGKKVKKIDGLTPEQRFFLSYAQVWKGKQRPEYLRLITKTDPHPPGQFRVNGPLANLPEFAKAFAIPPDSPMSLPASRRTVIW